MKRLLATGLFLALAAAQFSHAATYKFNRSGEPVEIKAGWLTKEGREVRRDNQAREKREAELASQYVPPKVIAHQHPIIYVPPIPAQPIKPKSKNTMSQAAKDELNKAIIMLEARNKENSENEEARKAINKKNIQESIAAAEASAAAAQKKQDQEEARDRLFSKKPDVKLGMSAKQVINGSKWGEPSHKSTRINANGKFEIWQYDGGAWLSLKNSKVTSINY